MSIFKRIAKIFQAETHSLLDKLEDPIKMTEQGIRDMKADLEKAIHALAEVKALAIRTKNEALSYKNKADEYQQQAIELLKRAQAGMLDQVQAETLAAKALQEKNLMLQKYQQALNQYQQYQQQVQKLEQTVSQLKSNIHRWENELRILKARASVAKITKKVNKELAQIDTSSTVAMLERMKEKIAQQEALAQAYSEISQQPKSLDEQIKQALGDTSLEVQQELQALKAQLNQQEQLTQHDIKSLPQVEQQLQQLKQQIQNSQKND